MIKVILLCAIASMGMAQDLSQMLASPLPMISNLCKSGCPAMCQAMSIFCVNLPVGPSCDEIMAMCDGACDQTCTCVDNCGPDCDTYETNCVNLGLPLIGNVFCPISGGACDVACVGVCPQQTMINLFQQVAARAGQTVQGLVGMVMAQMLSLMPSA